MLSSRVRLVSLNQVAEFVCSNSSEPKRAAAHLVRRLLLQDRLDRYSVVARTPRRPEAVLTQRANEKEPDFRQASLALRQRYNGVIPQRIEVVRLGRKAALAHGCPQPRRVRPSEASHDLQLAQFALHAESTNMVSSWQGEDALRRSKRFASIRPDALATLPNGELWIIEGGGTYSASKLKAFHHTLVPQLQEQNIHGYQLV